MCGIWALLGIKPTLMSPSYCVKQLEARGPEGLRIVDVSKNIVLGFTRLAINGLNEEGMQPMSIPHISWVCNGEIYNWRALKSEHLMLDVHSGSDCEVIGHLYEKYADNLTSFFRSLDGVFAIILVDLKRRRVVVGRDPYGVRPLYYGMIEDEVGGTIARIFSSEIKGLGRDCIRIQAIQPGHYYVFPLDQKHMTLHETCVQYHTPHWVVNPSMTPSHPSGLENACSALRFALEEAVRKRLMTERPIAALLSGGVDSSLIAALAARFLRERNLPPLKTFSIGMPGSTDLKFARQVADWIGSDHTEIVKTANEFFSAIPHVVRDIGSYDTTSVRASVGNWLVSKTIAEVSDCKVVFNGDGSDEIFGSYLYFYKAPTDRDFEEETERLLRDIHMFDVLRSDRCISSHGLEPRTPFLDKQFVAVAKQIATCWRRPSKERCEKWILRRAFDDGVTLPREVLWRRKEAFSDGVSSTEKSWYEEIQERCTALVPPDWATKIQGVAAYDYLTPQTAEQYYYRYLFLATYGPTPLSTVPYFWMPKWSPGATDPSARTLAVYSSS